MTVKARSAAMSSVMLGTLATFLWCLFSSALIILNKDLYRMGFAKPFFVTGMGQLFSFLGGLALVYSGSLPLRKLPDSKFVVTKVMPIVASSALSMFFGNSAYLYLSVSFIQILKSFTPALTLLLCVLAGLERVQWPLLLSVMLIAVGTTSAILVESGTPAFSIWGLLAFGASSIAEAARVVGAEVLLGSTQRFNSAEALVYVGGPTAVLLLLGSVLWEDMVPGSAGWVQLAASPTLFFFSFTMSFLVNLSCFFAIQNTSSVTFKVAGCLKNVAVVWYGVAAHSETVTAAQMGGYAVSVLGFAIYSRLKLRVQRASSALAGGSGAGARGGGVGHPGAEVQGSGGVAVAAAGGGASEAGEGVATLAKGTARAARAGGTPPRARPSRRGVEVDGVTSPARTGAAGGGGHHEAGAVVQPIADMSSATPLRGTTTARAPPVPRTPRAAAAAAEPPTPHTGTRTRRAAKQES